MNLTIPPTTTFGKYFTYLKWAALVLCFSCITSCNNLNEKLPPPESNTGQGVQSSELNLKTPYVVNPFLNETIVPLLNDEGKPVNTGKAIPVSFKPLAIKTPIVTQLKAPLKIPYASYIYTKSQKQVVPLNASKVKTFTLGKDTSSYELINSFGKLVKTGVKVKLVPKIKFASHVQPQPTLPMRMKDDAAFDIQYLDVEQGLSSSYINDMASDADGNIWLATLTGGLSKYDGKSISFLTKKEKLTSNNILCICFDKDKKMWFGSGRGLTIYDGYKFSNYAQENGFIANLVNCIVKSRNGGMWIGTAHGLAYYKDGDFTFYSKREGLLTHQIRALLEDDKGQLWIGTDEDGVVKFDGTSFTSFGLEAGLANGTIRSLAQDKQGNIWIGTKGNGPIVFDGKSFTSFLNVPELAESDVRTMVYANNSMWVGTLESGIFKYDGKQFIHFNGANGFTPSTVNCIMPNKDGAMFVGTQGAGLCKINEKGFQHYDQLKGMNNGIVNSISGDKKGNVYFSRDDAGLIQLKDSVMYLYNKQTGLSTDNTYFTCTDDIGNVWCATRLDGIMKITETTCTTYTTDCGLPTNEFSYVFMDRKKNLWFGTADGHLLRYKDDIFELLDFNEVAGNKIRDIDADSKNNLWITVSNRGITKFDGKNMIIYSEKEGLVNNDNRSTLVAPNDDIWVCTSNTGVMKISGNKAYVINEDNGLMHNLTWSILQDNKKRIFAGTEAGLSLIEEYKDAKGNNLFKIKNYGRQQGLKSIDFYRQVAYIDASNRAWWFVGKNTSSIHLDDIDNQESQPNIKITQIDVDGGFVDFFNLSDELKGNIQFTEMDSFYNYPKTMVLPYANNHLSFHFNSINYTSGAKIKYEYMLVGADKKWGNATLSNKVDYRNIAYGNYKFVVRAIDEKGNRSEIVEYVFTIKAPWWHTWWFRVICLVLVLSSIWYYIKKREQKLIAEKEKLESIVIERTTEVLEQKHQIEEKHREITDSINYAERIQRSFLATKDLLDNHLNEYFIFFKPKDVVSGDFYWASQLSNGKFAMLTADSTGHGVPGAIMSLLNITSVETAVKDGNLNAASILNATRSTIIERLKKDGSEEGGKDGMDACMCIYDFANLKLNLAAAHNPVWIMRKIDSKAEDSKYEMIEIKADKMPVGKHHNDSISFTDHYVDLQKGDLVYTFTDGYPDQFGGESGKKFMIKKLRELLCNIAHHPLHEQEKIVRETFNNWLGKLEQIDDVCLVGIKV